MNSTFSKNEQDCSLLPKDVIKRNELATDVCLIDDDDNFDIWDPRVMGMKKGDKSSCIFTKEARRKEYQQIEEKRDKFATVLHSIFKDFVDENNEEEAFLKLHHYDFEEHRYVLAVTAILESYSFKNECRITCKLIPSIIQRFLSKSDMENAFEWLLFKWPIFSAEKCKIIEMSPILAFFLARSVTDGVLLHGYLDNRPTQTQYEYAKYALYLARDLLVKRRGNDHLSLELVNKGTSQCFFNVVAMILNDFAMTGDIEGVEQKLQYFGTNLRTNILPRCLVTYAIRYAMENGKKKTEKNVVEFLSSIYKRSIVKEEHIENGILQLDEFSFDSAIPKRSLRRIILQSKLAGIPINLAIKFKKHRMKISFL